jgi:tetraacyldisaccharide 4'-kinase
MRESAEWLWYDRGTVASVVRFGLSPVSALFGIIVSRRNRGHDARVASAPLPALSVGNLTVGGTGKTPVSSWFARRLQERGASPAIVLRGYGDDEWRVHQLLTPALPVLLNADRCAAMAEARLRGADCAVLDDAFQHRRAGRVSDVVLVSADRFPGIVRLLPSGPFRERLTALRRATAIIITVKAASTAAVARVETAVRRAAPGVGIALVRLQPDAVHRALPDGDGGVVSENPPGHAVGWLSGKRLVLASAIADTDAFEAQMVAQGVRLVRHARFPDHHDFGAADVTRLVLDAARTDGVLCTLKDAVKLAPRWPREAPPLWYVSQTLVVDRGAEVLERECDRVLAARASTIPTAG